MEKMAIVGCGTMGHSIALNAAWRGIPVTILGLDQDDLDRCMVHVRMRLARLQHHGLLTEKEMHDALSRITLVTEMEKLVEDTTYVIEAVTEDLEVKKQIFQQLDSLVSRQTILASTTSGLDPALIASQMKSPDRFIVAHFWNPAYLIPLVEVARVKKTSDETHRRTLALLGVMKKKTIEIKKPAVGFVGNRLQFALFREAQQLLEEGIAAKEDIDAAVTFGIGRRLPVTGPLLSADLGGLDVFGAISDYLFRDLSVASASLPTLKNLVHENKLGAKTGQGYYQWNRSFIDKVNINREDELIRYLKQDLDDHNY